MASPTKLEPSCFSHDDGRKVTYTRFHGGVKALDRATVSSSDTSLQTGMTTSAYLTCRGFSVLITALYSARMIQTYSTVWVSMEL